MKRVNTFVDMDTELVKGSKTKAEESFKRDGEELESDNSKKQKIDEHVEAKGDDDQEEAEMKKHMEIVKDDEVAIDAIPLATKPPVIMLQNIDREDLETLWKLVKAKHGNTRPEEAYERVLWGDLKVMFEPDIESEVWRSLEGHNVTVWKLFSSSGVHFVRFKNLHIFMLVEKKYPLTPATITGMLNKKLQVDQWNEMSYQLLKLLVKQQKNPGISAAYTKVNAAGMKVTTAERLQLLEEFLLWKSCQGDSSKLNLPDHRLVLTEPEDSYKDGDGDTLFQQNLPLRYQDYQDKDCQGRFLASFLDDAKYEHVGQDIRSQDGKDDQDKQGKDLKISESKTKSKDNDKGSRASYVRRNIRHLAIGTWTHPERLAFWGIFVTWPLALGLIRSILHSEKYSSLGHWRLDSSGMRNTTGIK
ncbi:hypothetical protein Tco_1392781 [Tanacetum coccineum]